jgi:membrane associated rhomboid family serine protease
MTSAYLGSMVGASGAIYGLLVAFAFMAPNAELALMFIPIPIKAKYFVPGLLCLDLFLGVKGNSIFGGGTEWRISRTLAAHLSDF